MSGSLFVFEGIDHVGKTTIVQSVKERLISNSFSVISLSFPGRTAGTLGNLVYNIHHNTDKYLDHIDQLSLQMLHIAAHIDNINNIIIPNLNEGKIVLLDRFWWSTYAYGIGNSIDISYLQKIIDVEKSLLEKVSIKKIFLIERQSRESDYSYEKEKLILNAYNQLASSSVCDKIQNNEKLDTVVNKVYEKIQESLL